MSEEEAEGRSLGMGRAARKLMSSV